MEKNLLIKAERCWKTNSFHTSEMNCKDNIRELNGKIILRLPYFLDVIPSDYALFKF